MRKTLKTVNDLSDADLTRYGSEAVAPVKKERIIAAVIQPRPTSLARLVFDADSDNKAKR
jgi:hypothetical protein